MMGVLYAFQQVHIIPLWLIDIKRTFAYNYNVFLCAQNENKQGTL